MLPYFKRTNIYLLKSLVALTTIFIFYWQDFTFLYNEALNNDFASHIILIPFLLFLIIYRIRFRLAASITIYKSSGSISKDFVAIIFFLLSYVIKIYGSYTFQPTEYRILSLPFFIVSVILFLFNYETLKSAIFPIIFTLLIIPPPFQLAQQIGSNLSFTSSQLSFSLLKISGLPVYQIIEYGSPIIYLLRNDGPSIPFVIDIACSGLHSLIGFLVFTVFLAYMSKSGLFRKLAILVLGIPVIYSLNIFRIFLIVTVGHFFGPTRAMEALHFFGGWVLIFLGTTLLILVLNRVFKIEFFQTASPPDPTAHIYSDGVTCDDCGIVKISMDTPASGNDFARILTVLIIALILVQIKMPVFTLTEVKAEIMGHGVTGGTQTSILPSIDGYEAIFLYRDYRFMEVSGQDDALMYLYKPLDPKKDTLWVGIELGSSKYVLHPWEVCLITYPTEKGYTLKYTQVELKDILLIDNPPTTARFFVSTEKATNITQAVLYWYTKSIFIEAGEYVQKWAKISVIKYLGNNEEVMSAELIMVPIATKILTYWNPIVKWSWIALTIAEYGRLFISILIGILITVLTYKLNNIRVKRETSKKLYSKIRDENDKELLDVIKSIDDDVINIKKIYGMYNKVSEFKIEPDALKTKLNELEKLGVIEKKLTHIDDYPYMTYQFNL